MSIKELLSRATPGEWEIKEVMGQKFIAAKPYEGHPYFRRTTTIEIMSDEDYPTKDADIELIVALVNLAKKEKCLGQLDRGTP